MFTILILIDGNFLNDLLPFLVTSQISEIDISILKRIQIKS